MTYPTIRPKVIFDFQNSRQLDPRISFSRSSGATYLNPATGLITSAPNNVARFEKEGLLIEGSETNLVQSSSDYSSSPWQKNGTSTTANSGIGPDGTNNASLLESTVNGFASLKYYAATTGYATLSVYAKAGTSSGITLYVHEDQIRFDLATGTITTTSPPSTVLAALIQHVGNGWYRCSLTSNKTGQSEKRVMVNNSNGAYAASIGDNVLIWGVQIEESSFLTSYIPTSGSTVTRAADIAQITGDNFSSWYNPSQGTIQVKYGSATNTSSNYKRLVSISDSSSDSMSADNGIMYGSHNTPTSTRWRVRNGGSTWNVPLASPPSLSSALAYEDDNLAVSYDGKAVDTEDSYTIPTALNRLDIRPNGHISRLAYYDRRLSDTELETITS